jgi:flavin-dependent dehydrogenase
VLTEDGDARYDVVILGGGLAGLTLALQLRRTDPSLSVLVAERRDGPAPLAAFKVGESTVDVSAHYFGEILGLWDHMAAEHVYKAGLRFFFPAGENRDIARRVEFGVSSLPLPVPTYQLDRGRFENELAVRVRASGVDLLEGCRALEVDLGNGAHRVELDHAGTPVDVGARWVVDATGRASLLKRKLGLAKAVEHKVDAAWLRLAGGLDLEDWSGDPAWMARMSRPGIRRQSTTHLMGEGYWVWLIPLGSGSISIGIVTDPRYHAFTRIDTLDAALAWLAEYEPPLGAAVAARRDQVQDFLRVRDFSYGAERVFSPRRWALTGEAGVFADPLYSPGSDFIAYGNTYLTDLIVRDKAGEDIAGRTEAFNAVYLIAFDAALQAYVDHYPTMGNPQVMACKVAWDHAWYWGINALRFIAGRQCDLEGMATIGPPLLRAVELTRRMQEFFREWHALDREPGTDGYIDPATFPLPLQAALVGAGDLGRTAFVERLAANVELLEAMAVGLFGMAARRIGIDLDDDVAIDPYKLTLVRQRWKDEGTLPAEGGLSPAAARAQVGGLGHLSVPVSPGR